MLPLFKIIILFGACALVKATIFDIKHLYALAGMKETLADFSNVSLGRITEDGITAGYQKGSFTFKIPIDESIMAEYGLRKKNEDGNFEVREEKIVVSCEFFDNFNTKKLPPLAANHNDFPPTNGSMCPKPAVDSIKQLNADSELEGGDHLFYVVFLKDGSSIGGFFMDFTVLKCKVIEDKLSCDN